MKINNLGPIKNGEIEFNDLVVIWGNNNSGKTMLTYLLYAIKEEFKNFKFELSKLSDKSSDYHNRINEGSKILITNQEILALYNNFQKYFESEAPKLLAKYFAVNVEYFTDFNIQFSENEIFYAIPMKRDKSKGVSRLFLDGKTIKNTFLFQKKTEGMEFSLEKQEIDGELLEFGEEKVTGKNIADIFTKETFDSYLSGFFKHMTNGTSNTYFPAERIGINQFREELKLSRASKTEMKDGMEFEFPSKNNSLNRNYPLPVEEYIQLVFSISGRKGHSLEEPHNENLKEILEGQFIYNEDLNDYEYLSEDCNRRVPFKIMSSSLKSLFGLYEYLNDINPWIDGGTITIDEPEMNLHPSKQVKLILELSELIGKYNIKMVLSTHSGFIARKLINIVLKNSDEKSRSFKNEQLSIYETSGGQVKKINLLEEHSYLKNFDETSLELDEEYFSLIEE